MMRQVFDKERAQEEREYGRGMRPRIESRTSGTARLKVRRAAREHLSNFSKLVAPIARSTSHQGDREHSQDGAQGVDEGLQRYSHEGQGEGQNEAHAHLRGGGNPHEAGGIAGRFVPAQKRGGDWRQVTLAHAGYDEPLGHLDLLALDEALARLASVDDRQAQVVEMRFFGGLTVDATAEVLGVSPRTVELDWRMAKAWLSRALSDGAP